MSDKIQVKLKRLKELETAYESQTKLFKFMSDFIKFAKAERPEMFNKLWLDYKHSKSKK